jgi:hypothetical protein
MANFLNHLAGRALGVLPTVEPLVPARFSPSAEPIVHLTPYRTEAGVEADSHAAAPLPSRIHRNAADDPSPEMQDQPHLKELPPPPSSNRATQPTAFESIIPIHTTAERSLSNRAKPIDPLPARIAEAQARHDLRLAQTYSSELQAKAPLNNVFPASPALPQRDPRHAPIPVPSPPTPSIRVMIGRIDVRAELVSPQPSNTQRRPRPATVSLDQFLKQRSAGGR